MNKIVDKSEPAPKIARSLLNSRVAGKALWKSHEDFATNSDMVETN